MGRQAKQQANHRRKIMRNIIHEIEFEKMVKEMKDEDSYTLNHPKFKSENGLTLSGLQWKQLLMVYQNQTIS